MIRCLSIIVGIILGAFPAIGQESLRFEHITTREGLSQNSVFSIYQDQYGYMWIGTRDGLNLYDGKSIRVFNHKVDDINTLTNSHIPHILEDFTGDIWISTFNGLTRYNRKTECFSRYYLPDAEEESIVFCTFEDSRKTLWVGAREGLFQYNRSSNKLTPYRFPAQLVNRPGRLITAIFEDHMGILWFGTNSDGLYAFNPSDSTITLYDTQSVPALSNNRIETIITDDKQNLWIGTYGGGVNILNKSRNQIRVFAKGGDVELNNNLVRALLKDRNGNIWIGTFSGLHIYYPENNYLATVLANDAKANGLNNNSIRSLFEDKKGSIWVGTYFGGINLFDPVFLRFRHYNYSDDPGNSLSYNVVSTVVEDELTNLWIGTERGGLNYYERSTGHFLSFLPREDDTYDELPPFTIKSLLIDGDKLWVGTHRLGLYLFSIPGKRFARIFNKYDDPSGLYDAIINAIYQDNNGELWLCTESYGGLYKFDPHTNKLVPFRHQAKVHEIIQNTDVRHIFQDDFGNFWISTKGKGIIIFNEETTYLEHFFHDPDDPNSLKSNHVYQVMQDRDGELYIATYGAGIGIFDRITKGFDFSLSGKGLLHDKVYGMMQDKQDNIWISTNQGISRYDKQNGIFRNFDYKDELPLSELTEGAHHLGKYSGNVYFGGIDGLVEINPEQFPDHNYAPPIVITGLKLFNKEVRPGDETRILSKSIVYTSEISLKYNQSILTIDFAALNYIFPSSNSYAFMMEGLETTWNEVGNQTFATYTVLNPGRYVFLVKASNNDGFWSETPASLYITVMPPPWKQWWAYLIYACVIAALLYLIRHMILKSEKLKTNMRIHDIHQQKLQEINEAKIDFFTRISHEFRTPLTLIISPLNELISSREIDSAQRKRLNLIMQNAKLLNRLADQLMDFRKLEAGKEVLHVRPGDWVNISRNVYSYFLDYANARNIHFTFSSNLKKIYGPLDKSLIEKALFNVISNAFKHTADEGKIKIRLYADTYSDTVDATLGKYASSVSLGNIPDTGKPVVIIKIEDSGSGIKAEKLRKIFDNFYQIRGNISVGTGIGLSIVKNSILLHHGCIKLFSELHHGTVMLLILPLDDASYSREEMQEMTDPAGLMHPQYDVPVPVSETEPNQLSTQPNAPALLVIEDDPELVKYLSSVLGQTYHVQFAETAKQALAKIYKDQPALIICDIMLSGSNGISLCKRIKQNRNTRHIPVIMLTADTSEENRVKSFAAGVDAYITKPFSPELLQIRIKNLIQSREPQQKTTSKKIWGIFEKTGADKTLTIPETIIDSDEKLLERIRTVIRQRISDPKLNVAMLGKDVGVSRVQVYRKVKELTGMTAVEYIRTVRLEHAAKLLLQNKLSIKEVAGMTGFKDIDYFRIHFKERFGTTPSTYSAIEEKKNS